MVEITVVETENEFLKLKTDWDKLSEELTVFNNFNWIHTWWNHCKKNSRLKILVAKHDNEVVGIAPLYIKTTKKYKVIKLEKLKILGGFFSEHKDFIIKNDYKREIVFNKFLSFISNKLDYDVMEFKEVNSASPNYDLWSKYNNNQDNIKMTKHAEAVRVDLSKFESFDDYYNKLGKGIKKSFRAIKNKINNDNYVVEFEFKQNITKEDIAIMGSLNLKRQDSLKNKGIKNRFCYFTDKYKRNFIEDYFCNKTITSKMLAYVKFNGKIVAYYLNLMDKNNFIIWNCGLDPLYESYSPTKLILSETIKYAFENNFKFADLMRGSEPYKYQWTNDIVDNYKLFSNKSLIYEMASACKNGIKNNILIKSYNYLLKE